MSDSCEKKLLKNKIKKWINDKKLDDEIIPLKYDNNKYNFASYNTWLNIKNKDTDLHLSSILDNIDNDHLSYIIENNNTKKITLYNISIIKNIFNYFYNYAKKIIEKNLNLFNNS